MKALFVLTVHTALSILTSTLSTERALAESEIRDGHNWGFACGINYLHEQIDAHRDGRPVPDPEDSCRRCCDSRTGDYGNGIDWAICVEVCMEPSIIIREGDASIF